MRNFKARISKLENNIKPRKKLGVILLEMCTRIFIRMHQRLLCATGPTLISLLYKRGLP